MNEWMPCSIQKYQEMQALSTHSPHSYIDSMVSVIWVYVLADHHHLCVSKCGWAALVLKIYRYERTGTICHSR